MTSSVSSTSAITRATSPHRARHGALGEEQAPRAERSGRIGGSMGGTEVRCMTVARPLPVPAEVRRRARSADRSPTLLPAHLPASRPASVATDPPRPAGFRVVERLEQPRVDTSSVWLRSRSLRIRSSLRRHAAPTRLRSSARESASTSATLSLSRRSLTSGSACSIALWTSPSAPARGTHRGGTRPRTVARPTTAPPRPIVG